MSGHADTGAINHPAMHICNNAVGTTDLDVNGNSLTSAFVESCGVTPDSQPNRQSRDGTTKCWTDNGTTTGTAPAVTPERFYRSTSGTVEPWVDRSL